jgi:predicted nucleotidyltransferase
MLNDFDHGLTEADLQIIHSILQPYADKIDKIGLFGSRATGKYKAYSDIDMVLYGDITEAEGNHIATLFTDSLLIYKVDVVIYNHIDYAPLRQHIDKSVKFLS